MLEHFFLRYDKTISLWSYNIFSAKHKTYFPFDLEHLPLKKKQNYSLENVIHVYSSRAFFQKILLQEKK